MQKRDKETHKETTTKNLELLQRFKTWLKEATPVNHPLLQPTYHRINDITTELERRAERLTPYAFRKQIHSLMRDVIRVLPFSDRIAFLNRRGCDVPPFIQDTLVNTEQEIISIINAAPRLVRAYLWELATQQLHEPATYKILTDKHQTLQLLEEQERFVNWVRQQTERVKSRLQKIVSTPKPTTPTKQQPKPDTSSIEPFYDDDDIPF